MIPPMSFNATDKVPPPFYFHRDTALAEKELLAAAPDTKIRNGFSSTWLCGVLL
jgi:hypothetical protein